MELKRVYALRISDDTSDDSQNANLKNKDCMKATWSFEAAFTSYTGPVQSIKGVLDGTSVSLSSFSAHHPVGLDQLRSQNAFELCHL